MSSFRNYSDTGSYRARSSIAGGSTFGRNASTGSSYSNYRNSYTGLGSSSIKTGATKERSIGSSYGTNFTKKDGDKVEEKPSYKYSCTKNSKRDRAIPTKISKEDTRPRSRSSNAAGPTSILEKYTLSSKSSSTERPSSVLDRYRSGSASREVSREPDSLSSRYGGSNSYSESSRSYGSDKKDKESSYRTGLRPAAREPSPEIGIKAPGYRVYSRTPTFGKSSSASSTAESSSRYSNGSATTSGRYSLSTSRANPECLTSSIGYTTAERYRSPGRVKPEDVSSKPLEEPAPTEVQPTNGSKTSEPQTNGGEDSSSRTAEESQAEEEVIVVTVVTRGTSPTPPPALTAYTRTKRLEPVPKAVQKELKRSELSKIERQDREQQVDRSGVEESSSRYRYSSGSRPWASSYLDKYSSANSYTPRSGGSSRVGASYGYNSRSRNDESSSRRSPPRASEAGQKKTTTTTTTTTTTQRNGSEDREVSPRIVEGQDQASRRESLSRPGSVSRSGSLKSRHPTSDSSSSSSAVSLPTGCSLSRSSGKSAASSSAGASPTKIKSAAATSTAGAPPSSASSSSNNSSKCASAAGSSASSTRQASSPDARERKPPVPKSEMVGKSGAAMLASGPVKYVNKDFRKSALNMENGDPSRSQICERKLQKKCQRSVSVSSQDSEPNSESVSGKSKTPTSKSASLRNLRKTSSKSSCNNGRLSRTTSTSDCSSENSDSESSNSEEEEDDEPRRGSQRRRASDSAEGKAKTSGCSSRTSVLASSADELSVCNTDKPPRPPSSPRSRSDKTSGKTDEAKSFLMRALAPVTNLFKTGKQENSADVRNAGWIEACSEDNNSDGKKKTQSLGCTSSEKRTRLRSSGEKPWWLDPNSDNVPDDVERNSSRNDDISQDTTISTVLPDDGKFKFNVWRQDSEERTWWLDDNDNNIPPDEQLSSLKEPPPTSPTNGSLSRKSSTRSARSSPRQSRANRLRHQQSGERAWWLSDDPDGVPDGVEVIPVSPAVSRRTTTTESSSGPIGNRIRHIESGERPWWLDSSSNVPEGVQKIEPSNSNSDSSESFDKVEIGGSGRNAGGIGLSRFPLEDEPLGHRASPEGIENPPDPPDNYGGRTSPYDNVTNIRQTPPRRSAPRKRPANLPLFIGNSTNIDDLLGDIVGPDHSPIMTRNQKKLSRADEASDNSSEEEEECEEIDAAQVIIHDSTPQTPVIQRRHNRDTDRPQPDGYIPEPVPIGPWGTLNANNSGSVCTQYFDIPPDKNGLPVTEGRVTGSDDCLYLSINVPVLNDTKQKLPVIFLIHGGSYQYGNGLTYGSKNKYLLDRDIVFVTINYRLGILGFLSTEDAVLPGNLGLKDQSLALRWTSKNIAYFGGDPNRIILVGYSAGSSSVQYHYLSPLSRGLFHGSIGLSGTIFNPWGFTLGAREKAQKLAAIFNCPTQDSRKLVDCLKIIPAQTLMAVTKEFQYWQFMPEAPFAPVIEKAGAHPFINKSPKEIAEAKEVYDVPAVFGSVSEEGCDPGAGVCHSDDTLLVLENSMIDPTKTEKELKMSGFLLDMWESVAYNGVPNIGVEWNPVDISNKKMSYLHIYEPGNYSMSGNANFGHKYFWKKFFPSLI